MQFNANQITSDKKGGDFPYKKKEINTDTHIYTHNKQTKSLKCFAVVARVRRTENLKERSFGRKSIFLRKKTHKVEKEFREESRLATRTV